MPSKNCLKGCIKNYLPIKGGKKIFDPYDELIMYPWVKAWIDGEPFILSMGNASSANNEANIKSFNFGVSNGMGAKVEVADESGGVFFQFFTRMNYSNKANPAKSMYFQWGYNVQDQFGKVRAVPSPPVKSSEMPEIGGDAPDTNWTLGLPSPDSTQYVSSVRKLLIKEIECQAQSASTYKFIITGDDSLSDMNASADNRTFGGDTNPMHLTSAIRALMRPYNIKVSFVDMRNGNVLPARFEVPPNAGKSPGGQGGDPAKLGPLGKWNANNKSPLQAALEWMRMMRSEDGRGFVSSWQDTSNGQMLVFRVMTGDPCIPYNAQNVLGTYLVNAGKCSPVVSFQPNFSANLPPIPKSGSGQPTPAGGKSPNAATDTGLKPDPCANAAAMTNLFKSGVGNLQPGAGQSGWIWWMGDTAKKMLDAATVNIYANLLFRSITAELTIQGNPAFEHPLMFNSYSVGVVYVNPFRPKPSVLKTFGPLEWLQGNPSQISLRTDSCSPILSNLNWMIIGANHDIRDGVYHTTLQLSLVAPGATTTPGVPLGGTPGGLVLNQNPLTP